MKLNKKFLAAAGCAGVLAFAITGCSGKAAQADTPAQTEVTSEAETVEGIESSEEADEENAVSEAEGNAESKDEKNAVSEAEDNAVSEAEGDAESDVEENADLEADAAVSETICVWGPVVSVEEGSIMIDNQSGISSDGDMVLQIAEDTRILEAENGFPVELTDIKEGEVIYANIGPAMTMSLPPQTTAEAIICQVPEDFKAPAYVQVVEMELGKDESYVLTASNGETYQVAADCQIIPFLTRNIVTLQDVTEASTVLVWSDAENNAERLVLFAE